MPNRTLSSHPFLAPLVGLAMLLTLGLASRVGAVVIPPYYNPDDPALLVVTGPVVEPNASSELDPIARAITGVSITVADLDRSVRWYQETLDARLESTFELSGEAFERLTGLFGARARVAVLSIGQEQLELMQFYTPRGRPFPSDTRANDRWFQHVAIIVRDMGEAYERLRARGVEFASSEPQRLPDWNPDAGGIEAFYFRDPDGHFLEVLAFPPGKGEPRWQSNDRVFLGIDHTAIVVNDTDASLVFYRDTLGMTVAGTSENYGTEQEHLNAVFPAYLRITALRAPEGPAIELLEYLTPRTGRPTPIDSAPNDLWHWRIHVETDRPGEMFARSRAAGGAPVSPGEQHLPFSGGQRAHHTALLASDPDGHALLFHHTP